MDLNNSTILVLAPHHDDEVLGCGGLIASLREKEKIHITYVSDGAKSPNIPISERGKQKMDLCNIRKGEAIAALSVLGVPEKNLTFLDLPDSKLSQNIHIIIRELKSIINEIKPNIVIAPFSYDRHPDHLAVSRAARSLVLKNNNRIELIEYFIYFNYQLLPRKDIREYVKKKYILSYELGENAAEKLASLKCYKSQFEIFFPWQKRPAVPKDTLVSFSANPEQFFQASQHDGSPFSGLALWVRIVHYLEPRLKSFKDKLRDQARALFMKHQKNSAFQNTGR